MSDDSEDREENNRDSGVEYRKLRNKLLPEESKKHFDISEMAMKKNREKMKVIELPDNPTNNERFMFKLLTNALYGIYGDIDTLSRETEASFVQHTITKNRIMNLQDIIKEDDVSLNTQTQESEEKVMRWLSNYLKHNSKTSQD